MIVSQQPLSADFIAARVEAILAARLRKHPEGTLGPRWWIGGSIMFALGLADGLGWWIVSVTTHHDILPRLLP
jgi:hypothetical protein